MRRTLTIAVTAAAFLAPAGAASAAAPDGLELPARTNASCNNGHGGNYVEVGHTPKTHQIRDAHLASCSTTSKSFIDPANWDPIKLF